MSSRFYFAWRMLYEGRRLDENNLMRRTRTIRREFDAVNDVSDNEFLKRYRLSKEAFLYLCDILRETTALKSTQRVPIELKVLAALFFYAHGEYQRPVGLAESFSQQAISVYLDEVTEALNHPNIINYYIKFPKTQEARAHIQEKFFTKYGIPGVIGCVDGCHIKIYKPILAEEHLYYSRKHFHSLNVQMVCDSDCRILAVNAKYGGASHDAFIWDNSIINTYLQTLHRNGEIVWLLGDSGYPQRPWLMTPCSNPASGSQEARYNQKHRSARVLIENTFGRLKNKWRCLCKDRVPHYSPKKASKIVTACCVLYNLSLELHVPDLPEDEVSGAASNQHEDSLPGDSGYPQRPWLMTPCSNPASGSQEARYNQKHRSARVLIENTFGRLKNKWRCLCKDRVPHYSPKKASKIVTACCVLYNLSLELHVPDLPEDEVSGAASNQHEDSLPDEEEEYELLSMHQDAQSASELIRGRAMRQQLIRRICRV